MTAYYNEHDPFAAGWLRELIAAGLIAPGEVDEQDIQQIKPEDLKGFTQCHFFAGIGVWSYALRAAGWPDDTPVWTGSCPCQSFSASGKRGGFSDQRHLWPAWFRLIRQCRPHVCFGEQVASKDRLAWFDVVSSDLEGAGYAVGAADTCAAGFGAPHIRQRLYFVAESDTARLASEQARSEQGGFSNSVSARSSVGSVAHAGERRCGAGKRHLRAPRGESNLGGRGEPGELGDASGARLPHGQPEDLSGARRQDQGRAVAEPGETSGTVGDTDRLQSEQFEGQRPTPGEAERGWPHRQLAGPGPTNGFWASAEWLFCRDQKYRPVEPGTFPLAHGSANRVGRLRGYGNALCAPQAQAFIEAYIEIQRTEGRVNHAH